MNHPSSRLDRNAGRAVPPQRRAASAVSRSRRRVPAASRQSGAPVWSWALVVLLAAVLAMGGAGDAGQFYLKLERPAWAPGVGVFAPVWTFLYLQMAMAAVLVARLSHSTLRTDALSAFGVQLLANAAWSWVFFNLRDGVLALVVISLLWATLAATTALFWRLNRVAGVLMLPAWLWISYAAVLTGWLWADNPRWLG